MDLNLQNPWWKIPSSIDNDEKVEEALSKNQKISCNFNFTENQVILGPRQVGKTTMLKLYIRELIKKGTHPINIFYYSCEPLKDKKDIIDLVTQYHELSGETASKKYIILDEITLIKDWEHALKHILETPLSRNTQVIVTGSNAFLLKTGSERLPGRNTNIRLFLPLSFREYITNFAGKELKELIKNTPRNKDFKNTDRIYNQSKKFYPYLEKLNSKLIAYNKTGGYPKAIYNHLETGHIKEETYEIYVRWILGDLSKLDRREILFRSMIRGIIEKYSTKYSLHKFSKDIGIASPDTVSQFTELLTSLLLTNSIYQYDLNKKQPIIRKEKKTYFLDPLMYSVFRGYTEGKFQDYSTGNESKIAEGILCESLARMQRTSIETSHFLGYYHKKKETDFTFKSCSELAGIELKWQNKATKSDFSNYYSFKKRILVTKKDMAYDHELLTIPLSILLCLI